MLAQGLARRWGFLGRFLADAHDGRRSSKDAAREYGLRVAMIASVLGKRLSRGWTPDEVVALVERYGLTGTFAAVRTVIGAGDAHSPLKYLATVLDRALRNPALPAVAHHSPVREAYEREILAAKLTADAEHTTALRAQADQRTAAAAAATGEGLAAFRAARRHLGHQPSPVCVVEAATQITAAAAGDQATAWPAPAAPGAGIPYARKPVHDR